MRRLQAKSREMDATVWIGKQGMTPELLKHVGSQLKTRELVKLKVQKSALTEAETGDLAEKAAASTDSTLVEVMGHTFSLYKKQEVIKSPEQKKRRV